MVLMSKCPRASLRDRARSSERNERGDKTQQQAQMAMLLVGARRPDAWTSTLQADEIITPPRLAASLVISSVLSRGATEARCEDENMTNAREPVCSIELARIMSVTMTCTDKQKQMLHARLTQ